VDVPLESRLAAELGPGERIWTVRQTAFLVPLLAISACLLIPHPEGDSPDIQGSLFNAGRPVTQRRVALSLQRQRSEGGRVIGDSCSAPVVETRTDDAGSFSLPARSHFTPFFFIVGDRFAQWNVCIESEGMFRPALTRNIAGTPRRVHVSCDEQSSVGVKCVVTEQPTDNAEPR